MSGTAASDATVSGFAASRSAGSCARGYNYLGGALEATGASARVLPFNAASVDQDIEML